MKTEKKTRNENLSIGKLVVIEVRGGVAYLAQKPSGVEVRIVDFDTQDKSTETQISPKQIIVEGDYF